MHSWHDTTSRWPAFFAGLGISIVILFSALGGALADRLFVIKPLDQILPRTNSASFFGRNNTFSPSSSTPLGESTIIEVAEKSQPAVVTVAIKQQVPTSETFQFGPFLFEEPGELGSPVQQDIGTGFVVDAEQGFVVTNKHVVADPSAEYKLIDNQGNEHVIERIYRDPTNDLAILKTDITVPALPLADSDQLKIGQTVIAIGTALGEFRQTVTTGIISGLGRGIDASDGFQAERIDNLIQTDAAINPGNSGGPLFNSRGEVIGVNVAMARAENIGFAIPINVIKESLRNFEQTGKFDRALLGVQYKLIPKETALLNDVPEGAYVTEVIPNTTASEIGVQINDIIVRVEGQKVSDEKGGLASIINRKKIGDTLTLEVWREGTTLTLSGILRAATQ